MVGKGLSFRYLPPAPVWHIDTTVLGETFHDTDNLGDTPSEQGLHNPVSQIAFQLINRLDCHSVGREKGDLRNSSKSSLFKLKVLDAFPSAVAAAGGMYVALHCTLVGQKDW